MSTLLQSSWDQEWPLGHYLTVLTKKMREWEDLYFDYEFVWKFMRPWCPHAMVNFPGPKPTKSILEWAWKILSLNDNSMRNCDDCITLILDVLKKSWYISYYEYICGVIRKPDTDKLFSEYAEFTFWQLALEDDKLREYYVDNWSTESQKLLWDKPILSHQFIDKNGFFLGVWNWKIVLENSAVEEVYHIWYWILIYRDKEDKENNKLVFLDSKRDVSDVGRKVEISYDNIAEEIFNVVLKKWSTSWDKRYNKGKMKEDILSYRNNRWWVFHPRLDKDDFSIDGAHLTVLKKALRKLCKTNKIFDQWKDKCAIIKKVPDSFSFTSIKTVSKIIKN